MEGGKILGLHSQQMLNTWSLAENTGIVGIRHCRSLSAQNRLQSWLLLEVTDLGWKEDFFFFSLAWQKAAPLLGSCCHWEEPGEFKFLNALPNFFLFEKFYLGPPRFSSSSDSSHSSVSSPESSPEPRFYIRLPLWHIHQDTYEASFSSFAGSRLDQTCFLFSISTFQWTLTSLVN